ncbi:hypothetical protein HPB50_011215 [Hyalomma asiaticum]|uniref:Uncharacterized protein n=1 Tax=Hyalomma asiaticum TaxID=266040 RepID=A0ACB7SVD7_HYAAI|nr:hypothetical protein HPB50_011215 [Hyalomma asiaticum]
MLGSLEPQPDVASTRHLSSLVDTPDDLLALASKDPPLSKILCPPRSALREGDTSSKSLLPHASNDLPIQATSSTVNHAPDDFESVTHASASPHKMDLVARATSPKRYVTAAHSIQSSKSTSTPSPEVSAIAPAFFECFADGHSTRKNHVRLEGRPRCTAQVSDEDQGTNVFGEYGPAPNIEHKCDFVGSSCNVGFAPSLPGAFALEKPSGIAAARSLQNSIIFQNDGRQWKDVPPEKFPTFAKPNSSDTFVVQKNRGSASRNPSEAATTWHGSSLEDTAVTATASENVLSHPRPASSRVHGSKEKNNGLLLDNHLSAVTGNKGLERRSEPRQPRPRKLRLQQLAPAEKTSSNAIMLNEQVSEGLLVRADRITPSSLGETRGGPNTNTRCTSEARQNVATENFQKHFVPFFMPHANSLSTKMSTFGLKELPVPSDGSESAVLQHAIPPTPSRAYVYFRQRVSDASPLVSQKQKEPKISLSRRGDASSSISEVAAESQSSQHSTKDIPRRQPSNVHTPHQVQVSAAADNALAHNDAQLISAKEYLLYPVSVCLAFIVLTVVGLLFFPSHVPHFRNGSGARALKGRSSVTCNSMACLRNALYLNALLSWDRKKPCNDFYSFVCLRWTNSFSSPFDSSVSVNDDFVAFLEQKVHESLQDNAQNSTELRLLKDLYGKCNNYEIVEKSGWDALQKLLSKLSLANFPLISRTPTNLSVWHIAAQLVRETGTVALLSIGVAFHPVFAAIDVASVGPPELITRKNVGIEEALELYATSIFWMTHLSEGKSVSTSVASATQKFAGSIERFAQLGTKESTPKVQNLDTRSPLLKFVGEVFGGLQVSFFSITTPVVLIRSPDVVSDVMNIVERTETQVVVNYLVLRLVIQVAPFLPYSGLYDVNGALAYGKRTTRAPRTRLCLRAVERALFPAVHALLFKDTKLKTLAPALVRFVQLVVEEFNQVVDDSPLFDNHSKRTIRQAVAKTDFQVFGPGRTKNAALALQRLDSLPTISESESALSTYIEYHRRTLAYSLERGAKMRWSGSAFSDDCWYESNPWTVYIPLLAFNGTQVLNKGVLDALQLSRLAPRLVRCLFNMLLEVADSRNEGESWLTDNTWRKLVGAESSFKQQLVDLRFSHVRDVLASRTAFRVFKKIIVGSDVVDFTVVRKEGSVFTSAQMFFASMMLQNCEVSERPRKLRPSADSEKWSVALRNTKEFTEAFNCTLGNNMS